MMTQQIESKKNEEISKASLTLRRNDRGCKSKDFYNWPEQSLDDMVSPLAVQQYIQQLINKDPSNVDEILKLPENQDLGAWKIEHLRLFCMQLNRLAAKLQECCHPETCNQMTATEQWIFLCAAHKLPNECPAIDYTRHTLDGAASLLNSNKYFPSRVTIKESSVAKLGSVCRRIYRIFSHAYYHHFHIFEEFERDTHLCKRFSQFVTTYDLMSKDSLIVPSDGSRPEVESNFDQSLNKLNTTVSTAQIDVEEKPAKTETTKSPDDPKSTTPISKTELKNIKKSPNNDSSETKTEPSAVHTNASWTSSTNTMVKGATTSTALGTSKTDPEDEASNKTISDDISTDIS